MNHFKRYSKEAGPDSGVAMIMALVGSALLLVLSLLIAQAVVATIRPSGNNEASFQALAAAEAGVAEYQARLSLAGSPDKVSRVGTAEVDPLRDGRNPADWQWVPFTVGDASNANVFYAYEVIDDPDLPPGRVKVRSSGRVGNTVRTVDAVLAKRTSLDYGYVSGSETLPVDFPEVYGNPNSQQGTPDEGECDQAWYRPVSSSQLHRNSSRCIYYGISDTDRIIGNAHTNDVWYFDVDNQDPTAFASVFSAAVTSACRDGAIVNGQNVDCPANHRWILEDRVRQTGNNAYMDIEIPLEGTADADGFFNAPWNPDYDTVLELPDELSAYEALARQSGCVFSGPTRIRFDMTTAGNYIYVTSPDTRDDSVSAACALDSAGVTASFERSANATSTTPDPTIVLDYGQMLDRGFNGVFLVEDADQGSPTCTPADYPFVRPSSGEQTRSFPPSVSPWGSKSVVGFPLKSTKPDDPWAYTGGDEIPAMGTCSSGTTYLEGSYAGDLAVVSAASIAVTGQLWNADLAGYGPGLEDAADRRWCAPDGYAVPCVAGDANNLYGVPPETSENLLALFPGADDAGLATVYVYLPDSGSVTGNPWDWSTAQDNITNLAVDAAMVIKGGCFGLMDYDLSGFPSLGLLKVVGSLAQSNRCPVSFKANNSSNGYESFSIYYDERMAQGLAPPGFIDLFREPFRIVRLSEVNPNLVTDLPEFP